MPVISLELNDDYELVRDAAEREGLPVQSFARNAVLARRIPPAETWALVNANAEEIKGISPVARKLMDMNRGRSPEDGTYRANGCLWRNLTEPAAVIAYPTAHYTSSGSFEFVLDRHGVATVLHGWWDVSLKWVGGDHNGQNAAYNRAVALGNRRLGIAN